jgi:hypothetical protein
MNKRILFYLVTVLTVFTVSCGEKKKAVGSNQAELDEAMEYLYRDSTIYGTCGDGSAMNSLQLITDNGDTLLLSTAMAQESNALFGKYEVGDRMAVIASGDRTQAQMVINLTTLLGDWVTPNPLDGSSFMGFTVKEGGILESINQTSVIYMTWQVQNGQLVLESVRDGGGDFEEQESFKFRYLSQDSLVIENSEEIFEYSRPGNVEDYSDVKLDDEGDEYDDLVI